MTSLTIDGIEFSADLNGFDSSAKIHHPDGSSLELLPWTFSEHFNALHQSSLFPETGPQWDMDSYLTLFGERQNISREQLQHFKPAILWWASGGSNTIECTNNDSGISVSVNGSAITVSELSTFGEMTITQNSLMEQGESTYIHPVKYLEELLYSTVGMEKQELLQSHAELTRTLIEATLSLHSIPNFSESPKESFLDTLTDADLQRVSNVATVYGYSIKEILELPAWEFGKMERRLSVLQRSSQSNASMSQLRSQKPRMQDFPDAVVIHVEDD